MFPGGEMTMVKKTVLAFMVLSAWMAFGEEEEKEEVATGSSDFFYVCTSNASVRIQNVTSKFCDGEYYSGKGRRATFLQGVTLPSWVDFKIEVGDEDPDDPVEYFRIGNGALLSPEFSRAVWLMEVGEKIEVSAVTRNGYVSKPFRVNFDIAPVPVEFWLISNTGDFTEILTGPIKVKVGVDTIIYQPVLPRNTIEVCDSIDSVFMFPQFKEASQATSGSKTTVEGMDFKLHPEIAVSAALDSATGLAMLGTLAGASKGGKEVNINHTTVKGIKVGRMAGVGFNLRAEGDLAVKWNPDERRWVHTELAIGLNFSARGGVTFRFPQTFNICYVSGEVSTDLHLLLQIKNGRFYLPFRGEPLIEGCLEVGAGFDCCKFGGGGELGVILNGNLCDGQPFKIDDFGWGGQFYWTAEFFIWKFGNKGIRNDVAGSNPHYYWQHWVYHNGEKVDSVTGGSEGGDLKQASRLAASGPTRLQATRMAAPSRLNATEPEEYVCKPSPSFATCNGHDALLYLTNAQERALCDQSKLVCRLGLGGESAVEALWDDGTADMSPSVGVAGDGTIVAAWVNMKGLGGDPAQLTDVTREMEVAVGVRESATGVWRCRNVTVNGCADFSPKVAVASNGVAYVAWCSAADNLLYGSGTEVKCVAYANGTWGDVVSLGIVGAVSGLAVACDGVKGCVVCTVELAGAHAVKMFEVSQGGAVRSGVVDSEQDVNDPDVFYGQDGVARFHWLQGGALWTKSGFAADGSLAAEIAGEVSLSRDAAYLHGSDGLRGIVWQAAPGADGTQSGVSLMLRNDEGKWQAPATLWVPQERSGNFSGMYDAGGSLLLAFESAEGERDDNGMINYDVARVKTFTLGSAADLSVSANEIGFDGGRPLFDGDNEFVATIHNLGREAAFGVPVEFVTVANGHTNAFFSGSYDVAGGGSVCITSKWNAVEGYSNLMFRVQIDPECAVEDANRENNVAELEQTIGALAIGNCRCVWESDNVRQINAKVVTDGVVTVPAGKVVKFTRGSPDGEVLGTDTLGRISPINGYATGFTWNLSKTAVTSEYETVYVQVVDCPYAMTCVDVKTNYDPIPELGDAATAEQISEALAWSADVGLRTNIADAATYARFRAWAERVKIADGSAAAGRQAVKDSPYAWLAFALDSDRLLAREPVPGDLTIGKFEMDGASGVFEFEVSLAGIEVGDNADVEMIGKMFELVSANEIDGVYSTANIDLSVKSPLDGKVRVSARFKDGTGSSSFMKVIMHW